VKVGTDLSPAGAAYPSPCSALDGKHATDVCIALCVIALGSFSGLRQLVEEVVHGADDLGFVGIEDVVIGVGQTDHLS
jgi:hypothetical protein